VQLALAIALALIFALTNGLHDASNAIAALVATRAARPLPAVCLAAVFNLLGPLLLGAAVADTIGSIVAVEGPEAVPVITSALLVAVAWNVSTWMRGLPSSSGHALVGALVGAALVAGASIHWSAVIKTLVALALSPLVGTLAGWLAIRGLRRSGRRWTRRWSGPVRGGSWATSAALAFGHGANDASKSVGVIAALLLASGHAQSLGSPTWATLACASALTLGTALGGWRIVHTIGRGIVRLHPLDGVASQGASAGVLVAASALGAPVSTTQVVASAVVGTAGGRGRWRHVHWQLVRAIGLGWLLTLPVCAAAAAGLAGVWT